MEISSSSGHLLLEVACLLVGEISVNLFYFFRASVLRLTNKMRREAV
jgi:hypothetical protein